MRCKTALKKLNLYALGALDADASRDLEQHLRGCAHCRAELAALKALDDVLGTLPDARPSSDLWPAVRSRLRPRQGRGAWLRDAWRPVLTTVAALLLSFALFHHAAVAPVAPADLSFDQTARVAAPDEQFVAISWQSPLASEAALGVSLALADVATDGS